MMVALRSRLATRERQEFSIPGFKRAAVLVPLYVRAEEWTLLFTQRSAALRSHSGQISFPGGRVDEDDADLEACALREAEEEVGIPPCTVDLLGRLGDLPTPTGYVITPIVGLVSPAPDLSALKTSEAEVAEVFEIPLARLRDPAASEPGGVVERWGRVFRMISYRIDGRNIWGATARMVQELLEVLE